MISPMTSPGFWKDKFRASYLKEVDTYASALKGRLLPTFDGTEEELQRVENGAYETAEEWQAELAAAVTKHLTLTAVRQGLLNRQLRLAISVNRDVRVCFANWRVDRLSVHGARR